MQLPTLNATLNTISALFLLSGYRLIRSGNRDGHRRAMLAAFTTSTLFIVSYLTYHFFAGATPFGHEGTWIRTAYLTVLLTHTVLAVPAAPMAIATLVLGLRGKFETHRRLARIAFPVWLYVSVTGVIVYVMLYHAPGAAG
ncbi:MAG: DUF420 domain-containing protein [Acidobacteria bacterium]|nr:DUF420 domain-containing protein [Acidobacteriota bacterium]